MRGLTARVMLTCSLSFVVVGKGAGAGPKVTLEATLDATQEVPSPSGTLPGAGGTATFEYDEADKTIAYAVNVTNLTGSPILAHIHHAPPGEPGPVSITLDQNHLSEGSTPLPVPAELVGALFGGETYINVHTAQNSGGEIRGQIQLKAGVCTCDGDVTAFRQCVRDAIKALAKSERNSGVIRAVRRDVKRSSCGRTNGARKAVACCVRQPVGNIVTDTLCLPVRAGACAGLAGTSLGAGSSCFPSSPCTGSQTSVTTTTTLHGTTTTTAAATCVHNGESCTRDSQCCSQYCYLGHCY